jgi:hypothetical protein
MLKDQEKLLDLVSRQSKKNARLEEHLASGIGIDKLKKGETVRNPNYDPLDDLSSEEADLDEDEIGGGSRRKGRKSRKANA